MICSANTLHRRDAPWTRCRPFWTGFESGASFAELVGGADKALKGKVFADAICIL